MKKVRSLMLVAILPIMLAGCSRIPGTQANKIRLAEGKVRDLLIDGDSARFRNETVIGGMVCGQVNSKNRMAAYVGFVPFEVNGNEAQVADADATAPFDDCKDPIDKFLERRQAEESGH